MTNIFNAELLEDIQNILSTLTEAGVNNVLLIDMAGNIIATLDNGQSSHDIYSLAALAAANFGAVSSMAKLIGEEEFSLLFHKGASEQIHFSKVSEEYLLITIFGGDLSLGFIRLLLTEAVEKLLVVL